MVDCGGCAGHAPRERVLCGVRAISWTHDGALTPFVRAIVRAWLLAGTIDIVVACVYYPLTARVTVIGILQGIASGLLGASAFQGGRATAALGLACHYLIAFIWTVFFFLMYARFRVLSTSRIATAVLYGVFVSAVMRFVVLPLSNVASRPFDLRAFGIATVILIFSIGVPLTLVAGRYYGRALHES